MRATLQSIRCFQNFLIDYHIKKQQLEFNTHDAKYTDMKATLGIIEDKVYGYVYIHIHIESDTYRHGSWYNL